VQTFELDTNRVLIIDGITFRVPGSALLILGAFPIVDVLVVGWNIRYWLAAP